MNAKIACIPTFVSRSGPSKNGHTYNRLMQPTGDLRVKAVRPLLPPAILAEDFPVSETAAALILRARAEVEACLFGHDPRLLVVVGPCSVHDPEATLDYAKRLKKLSHEFNDRLLVVMRCYFEKPRTTIGWKGLVNDPRMDGSFRINEGLKLARKLLIDVVNVGLPTATEFLDTTVPQHIADLICWGAIGARTAESQTHRELASGLSMPVGFKNATDGNVQIAIDALKAARSPHWFPGTTRDGISAIVQTAGNPSCHVVLRGGSRTGPNFEAEHVSAAHLQLVKEGLPNRVMIDLSHANSAKDHRRQMAVAADVADQLRLPDSPIFGVMVESFLVEGRQDAVAGQPLVYGQSVTDACLSFDQTAEVLATLAAAV